MNFEMIGFSSITQHAPSDKKIPDKQIVKRLAMKSNVIYVAENLLFNEITLDSCQRHAIAFIYKDFLTEKLMRISFKSYSPQWTNSFCLIFLKWLVALPSKATGKADQSEVSVEVLLIDRRSMA